MEVLLIEDDPKISSFVKIVREIVIVLYGLLSDTEILKNITQNLI